MRKRKLVLDEGDSFQVSVPEMHVSSLGSSSPRTIAVLKYIRFFDNYRRRPVYWVLWFGVSKHYELHFNSKGVKGPRWKRSGFMRWLMRRSEIREKPERWSY